jgi:hypothetical protein
MTKRKFVLATRERPSFANNQATAKIRLQKSKGGRAVWLGQRMDAPKMSSVLSLH